MRQRLVARSPCTRTLSPGPTMAAALQAPSAASRRSYGLGPVSVPPALSGSYRNKLVRPVEDFLGESGRISAYNHIGFAGFLGLVLHKSRFALCILPF